MLGEPIGALTSTVADDPVRRQRPGRGGRDRDRRRAAREHRGRRRGSDGARSGRCRCGRARETLGALLLMQDVTELRRRDRQIMSKDATIREIHHRVKNNLQTVAALLRLQARRVTVPEARAALEESMRRVSSIALVHETLSGSIDDDVGYDDIVDRLLVMLSDVMGTSSRIRVKRQGSFGDIPAEAATTLVLVLTELVQNAIEHAFPGERAGARRCRGRPQPRSAARHDPRRRGRPAGGLHQRTIRSARPADRAHAGVGRTEGDRRVPAEPGLGARDLGSCHDAAGAPAASRRLRISGSSVRTARVRQRQGRRQTKRARARALRRLSARRSSSDRPPQTPAS